MKPKKTCNTQGDCAYKANTNAVCIGEQVIAVENLQTYPIDCHYAGYCDYQLPRDSRGQPNPETLVCTCDRYENIKEFPNCPIHGEVR